MKLATPLLVLLLAAPAARASCDADAGSVAFGVIDVLRTSQSTGRVTIRCDAGLTVQVGLSAGGGGVERRLSGPGSDVIPYYLYADPGGATPWGDGMVIGLPVSVSVDGGRPADLPVYGLIPPTPGVQPGTYVDTLLVTLIF